MEAPDARVRKPDELAKPARTDDAICVLTTEFEFVAGLIPYYRRLEVTALAGTGVILSGLLAAWAGLLGEGADEDAERTFGLVLCVAAWGPALLVLVELMALVRITRASSYVQHHLQPLAARLTSVDDLLRWEFGPNHWLEQTLVRPALVRIFVSSAPIIIAIAAAAIALPIAGLRMGAEGWGLGVGFAATTLATVVATYGTWETINHELRRTESRPADVERASAPGKPSA